jgi:uncharacterized delta-60 repeat protein
MKITNEVLESYLDCRTKGHLKLSGETGPKSYYDSRTDAVARSREVALARLVTRFGEGCLSRGAAITRAILKQGAPLLTDATIEDESFSIRFDALKRVDGASKVGEHHYLPVLHTYRDKIGRRQKLLLAVLGLVLARVQGKRAPVGLIAREPEGWLAKFQLDTRIYRQAEKILDEVKRLHAGSQPPRLMLIKHCRVCEFKERCYKHAKEADDISLLGNVSEKETPNGTLDTTFGNNGAMTIDVGASLDYPHAGKQTLFLSGNSIDLVGHGQASLNVYVGQLTAAGQLDPNFGAGGVVNLGQGFDPSLTAQGDGKLVAVADAGRSASGILVTRLLANGSPDTGFGTGGTATVPWSATGPFYSEAVRVDPLGRFVIGGWQGPSFSNSPLLVIRLTPTGALDTTFGVGGMGTSGSLVALNSATQIAMTLQPDGKTVLVGSTNDYKFAAVRFLGDSPKIGSFTANPNPVTAGSSLTLTASQIVDLTAGATITQVAFYYFDSSGNQVTLGTVTVSSAGSWTLNSATAFGLPAGTYTLYAQAEDSYGIFGDPLAITLTVQ